MHAVAGLEQAEGPADAVDLDEIGVRDTHSAALAGRPVLEEGAVALLVDGRAGGVEIDTAVPRGNSTGDRRR